jgi:hypothetical protein
VLVIGITTVAVVWEFEAGRWVGFRMRRTARMVSRRCSATAVFASRSIRVYTFGEFIGVREVEMDAQAPTKFTSVDDGDHGSSLISIAALVPSGNVTRASGRVVDPLKFTGIWSVG